MRRALALMMSVAVGGCSFMALPRVRSESRWRDEPIASRCSTSAGAPTADLFGAAITGFVTVLAGLVILNEATNDNGDDLNDPGYIYGAAIGVPFGAMMLTYGFSARYGYRQLDACRVEQREPLHLTTGQRVSRDLLESARNAAERGDCATSRALLARAKTADAASYDAATREPALARCVAQ
jgi:hypothetical protein